MMKGLSVFITCLIFCCFSCSQKEEIDILNSCSLLTDTIVLPESEKPNTCFYLEVYQYQTEIYTLCNCCICDKLAIPTNCEGQALCEEPFDCFSDFYENAEYLFAVTSD